MGWADSVRGGFAAHWMGLASSLCLGLVGCVQLSYRSMDRFQAPPSEAVTELTPGMELGLCLERLGAPWRVLELETDPGMILVYAWERATGWGLSLSGADDRAPGSFNLAQSRTLPRALTLWFDGQDRLERYEQGFLSPALASRLVGLEGLRPGSR